MRRLEPPSSRLRSKSPRFFIGQNSHGSWMVQDEECRCGGLFVDKATALKFALSENGHQPQDVVMVPGVLELDLNRKPPNDRSVTHDTPRRRRAG